MRLVSCEFKRERIISEIKRERIHHRFNTDETLGTHTKLVVGSLTIYNKKAHTSLLNLLWVHIEHKIIRSPWFLLTRHNITRQIKIN